MTNQNRKTSEIELTFEAMDQVSGGATFADMAAGMAAAGAQRGARRVAQSVGKCPPNHNGV